MTANTRNCWKARAREEFYLSERRSKSLTVVGVSQHGSLSGLVGLKLALLDTERLECRLNLSQPDDSLKQILPAFDRASVPCAFSLT
jgi:hypothetical protein